jgi:hypothetical protein
VNKNAVPLKEQKQCGEAVTSAQLSDFQPGSPSTRERECNAKPRPQFTRGCRRTTAASVSRFDFKARFAFIVFNNDGSGGRIWGGQGTPGTYATSASA